MKDTFSNMHPISNLLFFIIVISFTMFVMNTVCLVISLLSALAFALYLNGKKAVRLSLMYLIPMIILIVVVNPAINHEGVTILTYLPWGNPLTLESIIYGVVTAALLSAAVLWFSCLNTVMTSDKFICIFGRIIPSLSLVISMALRFVPKFVSQFHLVRQAQKCIGLDISDGSVFQRLKNALKIISIMITWSLENSIETADSMKSRGYGLKGRTSFSIFTFQKRDVVYIILNIIVCAALLSIIIGGNLSFSYFPSISGDLTGAYALIYYLLYFIILNLPLFINLREGLKWKHLKSKI